MGIFRRFFAPKVLVSDGMLPPEREVLSVVDEPSTWEAKVAKAESELAEKTQGRLVAAIGELKVLNAAIQDAKAERADIAKHRALSLIDWDRQKEAADQSLSDVEGRIAEGGAIINNMAKKMRDFKVAAAKDSNGQKFISEFKMAHDNLGDVIEATKISDANLAESRKRLQVMNAKVTNAKKFVKKWILDADAQANKIVAEAEAIAKTRAEVLAGYVHGSRRQENLEYEAIHKRNKDQIEQDHAILRGLNKSKADAGAAVVRIVKNGQKLISDAENQAIHIVANGHKVVNAIRAIP